LVLNKNKDKFMAYLQYYNYKKLTKDTYTPDSLVKEIDDLILKNRLYGLYSDNLMVGFLIVRKSRYFKIDNVSDKVDTFYIQEVYIDKSMRGRKLGKILLDYALLICPVNKKYISLMTYEGNIMANIAKSYGFELQDEESECPVNKLFFVRRMTDKDFLKNTNRITESNSPLYIKLYNIKNKLRILSNIYIMYIEILGLDINNISKYTKEDIKRIYKKIALECHPDKLIKIQDIKVKNAKIERFKKACIAYKKAIEDFDNY